MDVALSVARLLMRLQPEHERPGEPDRRDRDRSGALWLPAATVREGGVHLVLFGAFVFLASNP